MMKMFQCCVYDRTTWFVLIMMITTGAARSVTVKLVYQLGLQAPLFVTLLYLTGQACATLVHLVETHLLFSPTSSTTTASQQRTITGIGSLHGLSLQSHQHVAWIHTIPWQFKPVIPAILTYSTRHFDGCPWYLLLLRWPKCWYQD